MTKKVRLWNMEQIEEVQNKRVIFPYLTIEFSSRWDSTY
jgi:hypothetical protein